jgi:hypothetical protein
MNSLITWSITAPANSLSLKPGRTGPIPGRPVKTMPRPYPKALNWLAGSSKKGLACLGLAVLGLASTLPAGPLVIDLATGKGPATHRASGLLWGISATQPADDLIAALKPRLYRSRVSVWRQGTGMENFERMAAMGCRLQVVLSDEYSVRFPDSGEVLITNEDFAYPNITHWPGDGGDYELWDTVVRETFQTIKEAGLTVQWDVWEEPNYVGWWRASKEQFFETWARTYRLLKSLDPDAELVGPGLNKFDPRYLQEFLLFAKENDVLPHVLSWHEIIPEHSPVSISSHVQRAREFLREHAIQIDRIDINEFISHDRMLDPGMHVWYLTYLERARVTGACKATWIEKGTGIYNAWNSTLGGLLTYPELQPRATWWVFKRYADITGELVQVTGNRYVEGISGVNPGDRKVRVLVGRSGFGWETPFIEIQHLDQIPWLTETGTVRVMAQQIPVSRWAPHRIPDITTSKVGITSDTLQLHFPKLGLSEALYLELSPASDD